MRIVNVTAFRRPFSYASPSKGGVELDSGKESSELPITRVFEDPLILKDVEAGVAMIRLSDEDRAFITRLLKEGDRKVIVAKPPKVTKPKPKPKPKPAANKPTDTPSVQPLTPPVPAAKAVTEDSVKQGEVSLSDLQKGNTAAFAAQSAADKARKLKEIRTHMGGPMGSRLEGV